MLAIEWKPKGHEENCTPNVLPCRINHNGPVAASKRYWDPVQTSDGKKTAYFRGRKLYGNEVELPQGFQGYLFQKTDRIVPKGTAQTAEEDEDVEDGDVKVLEEQLKFDHIVVWGHQQVPEDTDPFLKGIKEMLSFTERIHAHP